MHDVIEPCCRPYRSYLKWRQQVDSRATRLLQGTAAYVQGTSVMPCIQHNPILLCYCCQVLLLELLHCFWCNVTQCPTKLL